MGEFVKLFKEGQIGKLVLKNRIVFPPMVTRYVTGDGRITDQGVNYYGERSRGGCGLVTVEASYPSPGGYPGRVSVGRDEVIPDLRKVVEAIHNGGAKAGIEINPHRGRSDEVDPASACELVDPQTNIQVRALNIDDIKALIANFGLGVRRAKEAGFDLIMIHGGSGYLISEFLSSRINKRTDKYGGNARKRTQLAIDLIQAAKEYTAPDYPITFRLTADERIEGGFSINNAVEVSKYLEEAGVDAIDIVSGVNETFEWVVPYMYMPLACNTDLSWSIKKAVKIPVSVAGNINLPEVAEQVLQEGKADFVDMGRALIADPQLPNKAISGYLRDIRRCLRCCRCIESIRREPVGPLVCSVNPAVGRENEFRVRLIPTAKKKRLLVIGGGPGGMEAAIVASNRGHNVTLWEKSDKLGGQVNIAAMPPGKNSLNDLTEYLKKKIYQSGVTIQLEMEATKKKVSKFSPDAVIVATGSEPLLPDIPGLQKRQVITNREVLSGNIEVGKKVIIVGGGFVGCETAEFLHAKGKDVIIIELLPELAYDFFYPYTHMMIQRLREKGIKAFTKVKHEKIVDSGMEITDAEGRDLHLPADNIVICTGSVPEKHLHNSLKNIVPEILRIGDCVQARGIQKAIYEGAEAGMAI
jgi:2,4-dienoyl-CoA reductase-like NADH-dependent reductase (Old Yellow Enzyme family)/thioredoxin reductase